MSLHTAADVKLFSFLFHWSDLSSKA